MCSSDLRRWSRACGPHGVAVDAQSTIGGGSLPGEVLPTTACAVTPPHSPGIEGHATAFAAALRAAIPPIVARIVDDRVLLDPRTVDPSEDWHVEATLAALCGTAPLPPDGN